MAHQSDKLPTFYLPHGGGPWHVMDDAFGDPVGYSKLREYLVKFGQEYSQKIKAILVISAHWEEDFPTVQLGSNPPLLYDYYGLPESTYHLNWSAYGNTELSERIENLIKANGFITKREFKRGYDHGTFVPLMIAFQKPNVHKRNLALMNWKKAPAALENHPRNEHLAPLFVIAGATGNDTGLIDYAGTLMGVKISGFKFG